MKYAIGVQNQDQLIERQNKNDLFNQEEKQVDYRKNYEPKPVMRSGL
jgi:hypothetical protein